MRVNIITIAFASGLLFSTAAFADETAATPAAAPTAAPTTAAAPAAHNPDDDVYCRTVTSTGSYITTRVCKTQREWKQGTANSQATLNQMQAPTTVNSGLPR